MIKRFRNLSIILKVSIVPLSMTLILLGLATYAFLLLTANLKGIDHLQNGIIRQTMVFAKFQNETEKSLSNLYRLTSAAASETDAGKIDALAKETLDETERNAGHWSDARQSLAAIGVPEEKLTAFDQAFDDYIKASKSVVKMANTDAGMALGFMVTAQNRFTVVHGKLATLFLDLNESMDDSLGSVVSDMGRGRMVFTATIAIVVTLAMVLSWFISHAIAASVTTMAAAMKALAGGNSNVTIPGTDRNDEIGAMAATVQVFKDNMIEADRLRLEQEEGRVKQEQERQKASVDKIKTLEAMAAAVEQETRNAVSSVVKLTGQMDDNAGEMSTSASAVSEHSRMVTGVANEALANVQTVASAAEQLSASIREISTQVNAASKTSTEAVKASQDARETIVQLSEAVKKIGVVTKLISDIAEQTNLLALNATIEAARAGDAGKGFAVVAGEVKSLANQTATATGEIGAQIAEVQNVTSRVVDAVKAIADSIHKVESVSTAIAAAVEEQSATTSEIARSVSETAGAVQGVSDHIAHVSHEAESTENRAGAVKKFSAEVAASIDNLRRSLIQIVRTSTSDVERRRQPRYEWNQKARVTFNGKAIEAQTANLSEGGMMLAERIPGAVVGSQFMISCDEFDTTFAGTVVKIGKRLTHVQFELSPEGAQRFAVQFKQRFAGHTPLKQAA